MTGMSWIVVYETFGWVIIAAMVPAILRRQFAPGAAMAWLVIICLHPYIGWALYMLVGETRLGPHRVERHRELVARYRCTPEVQSAGLTAIHGIAPEYAIMVRQAEKISTMPVVAEVDPAKLERIVENLVTNALKHTPPETRVSVSVASDNDVLLLRVDDSGPGIADDQKEEIFEPFARGNGAMDAPGTGIGGRSSALAAIRTFPCRVCGSRGAPVSVLKSNWSMSGMVWSR
jgi:signal transduction histidine kinase